MPWINTKIHLYTEQDYDDWFYAGITTRTAMAYFLKRLDKKQMEIEIKNETELGLILKEYFNKVEKICLW